MSNSLGDAPYLAARTITARLLWRTTRNDLRDGLHALVMARRPDSINTQFVRYTNTDSFSERIGAL
jgi:hypothetical protein